MREIKNDFKTRLVHAKEYCGLLKFLNDDKWLRPPSIQLSEDRTFDISQDLFKILKSNTFIIIYNIVESTIYNCITKIHDSIEMENIGYKEASDKIQELWTQDCSREDIKKTIQNIHLNEQITLEGKTVHISGSIDVRKISDIADKYGIYGYLNESPQTANSFLKVKNRRNHLSHGEHNYATASQDITVNELLKIVDDVENYLSSFLVNVETYIQTKKFRT